jgi:hypothetical protein
MSAQLALLEVDTEAGVAWSAEGAPCKRCSGGRMHLVKPSEPCGCKLTLCNCLAEGYAKCDACGSLRQVWPREMVAVWHVASNSAA